MLDSLVVGTRRDEREGREGREGLESGGTRGRGMEWEMDRSPDRGVGGSNPGVGDAGEFLVGAAIPAQLTRGHVPVEEGRLSM